MTSGPATIGVITTGRADFGIYLPVLRALQAEPDLRVRVWVSGMHLSPEFGMTVDLVEREGLDIADRVEGLVSSDSEEGVASSMGLTTLGFGRSLARQRPDLLVVMGDRFEMHAAATAAVPLRIPLAHIHGGEQTLNAIDNALRHSLTKLSNLHLTSTELAARRVRAMGEDPRRVVVVGAPALDHLGSISLFDRAELGRRFGLPADPFVLVTWHPETLSPETSARDLETIWSTLSELFPGRIVFTQANADAAGRALNRRVAEIVEGSSGRAVLVGNLGTQGYFSAMKAAVAMVGNSSSGIIEAASFGLPVVNVGDRQAGRERSANTLDSPAEPSALRGAVTRALSDAFRNTAGQAVNVYGDGKAAPRIVTAVRAFLAGDRSVVKAFHFDDGGAR